MQPTRKDAQDPRHGVHAGVGVCIITGGCGGGGAATRRTPLDIAIAVSRGGVTGATRRTASPPAGFASPVHQPARTSGSPPTPALVVCAPIAAAATFYSADHADVMRSAV